MMAKSSGYFLSTKCVIQNIVLWLCVIPDYITTLFPDMARKIIYNIMLPVSTPFIWYKLNSVLQADLNEALNLFTELDPALPE